MSVTLNYAGSVTQPDSVRLTDTAVTQIGDAAVNDTLTLSAFAIANDAAAAKTVALYWYDGSSQFLIWKKSIAQNDTAMVADLPIRLRKGNEIRVKGDADVWVTLIYSFNFPSAASPTQAPSGQQTAFRG
ncbi:hypothetical protein E0H36_08515 [Rhizobium leguminosarum bv. viciae]|uniref:hypothetical protein n=1 Tax=Rhizobium leguminosarum TaxID=384 RepID=UPI00103CC2B4|nr:hypothetical protein [Rhizobium leguminosarum]MBY5484423.1 hypothetical protein [Rhizobium leguminosarum]TBZ34482.1 hypothetical protein E0H36_08515 [Rhizobium leguminosarum bv. viciae]